MGKGVKKIPQEDQIPWSDDVLDNLDIKKKPEKWEIHQVKVRYQPRKEEDYTIPQITPKDFLEITITNQERRRAWRPPIREEPEEAIEAINKYIERCFKLKKVVIDEPYTDENENIYFKQRIEEEYIMTSLPTVTWLAFFLWTDRKSLLNYSKKPDFSPPLKWFVTFIEQMTVQEAAKWKINPKMLTLLLTNSHWYKEQVKDDWDDNKWLWLADVLKAVLQVNDDKRKDEAEKLTKTIDVATANEDKKDRQSDQPLDIVEKVENQSAPMVIAGWDKNSSEEKWSRRFY